MAEEQEEVVLPRVKLGTQGLEVSRLGYRCSVLTGSCLPLLPEEDKIAVIEESFNRGITFFDTADAYGVDNSNEYLVGKALKKLDREKIQVATKFGVVRHRFDLRLNGTPEYARFCCEASLKRLQVDYIDLYYYHFIHRIVPIEETMKELKKLVEEGKIRYIGLCETSADTIKRAHAVHPITALQMDYSLWTRDVSQEIIHLCRELGIGIVATCPIAHGLFAGKAIVKSLSPDSFLHKYPRITGEIFEKNKNIYTRMESLARKHRCTAVQLALSWVLHQGNDFIPILGASKIKNLHENIGSLKVKLTTDDLKEISDALPPDPGLFSYSYRFENTAPPSTMTK